MIQVTSVHEEGFVELIAQKLRSYNDSVSLPHQESRKPDAVVRIALKASEGDLLAGALIAEVYWGWLEIKKLYVEEKFRHQGLGSSLLKEAERQAKEAKATKAFLTTYAFQAKAFYEKHGYTVTGVLQDYPPGSAYYWMTKTL